MLPLTTDLFELKRIACLLVGGLLLLAFPGGVFAAEAGDNRFARGVEPILRAKYYQCHGEPTQKAELNLSSAAGLRKGGRKRTIALPWQAGRQSADRDAAS